MPFEFTHSLRRLTVAIVAMLGLAAGDWTCAAEMLRPIDLKSVKVQGEIGRRIDLTVNNNLLTIDIERDFLEPFRKKQALGPDGYVGLGKLIDSTVRFAVYTQDEQVLELKNHLVNSVIDAQEPDGYIGMMAPSARMWGLWDLHEMSYIILGLTTDYHYYGDKRSLDAARKTADYILERWSTIPADWEQRTRNTTNLLVTGMERSLIELYRETGDERYLDFCMRQRALADWDLEIVTGRRVGNYGHVYSYLSRCVAQLDLYELRPEARLLDQSRRAFQFMTAGDGATVTGAVGEWESWMNDQGGGKGLGETCATAYQLRWYDTLLRLEGSSVYGDLMERAIYNALFAAQSADGKKVRYYTPLQGVRTYWDRDTYCCPNNFRRIISELPTMVYYESGGGLAVNLYTASEAKLELTGGVSLKVKQTTDYPSSGNVAIRLDPSEPATFPLRLRIPSWCNEAAVSVNGKRWKQPFTPGAFATIERQWNLGDEVTLVMPMPWRFVAGRKRQAGRVVVMRGPMVFCWDPTADEALKDRRPSELDIIIDPASLRDSQDDSTVRNGGMACDVVASDDLESKGVSGNLKLRLTEYANPNGKVTYFRVPDLSISTPDELFSSSDE
jgi:DUF1680 family protein